MTTPPEEYRLIPLTQGKVAIVDAADYDFLNQWKWCARWDDNTQAFYAMRGESIGNGKIRSVLMHRLVMGLKPGDRRLVDHRAPNSTLDNRRSNLRLATYQQNARNRRRHRNNKSGFRGVNFDAKQGLYRARIMVNGKNIGLGRRKTAEAAYALRLAAEEKYYGEFGTANQSGK